MKFPVTLSQDEDGWYVVECLTIPGYLSQGKTRKQALTNIQEAIKLCLEVRKEKGLTLTTEYVEVEVMKSMRGFLKGIDTMIEREKDRL